MFNKCKISICSWVCGIKPSSAETTINAIWIVEMPATIFFMNFSCPGTSIIVILSLKYAKPMSIVIPLFFSSFR